MGAVFDQLAGSIDEFVEAFQPAERHSGAIFAIDGRVVGLEIFDAPSTWRKLASKLVRSYAVDAMDRAGESRVPAAGEPDAFMRSVVSGDAGTFPATGIGTDVRFSGKVIDGAALVAGDRAVHVTALAR